ncbi:MAG TPA: phage holin family protein [Burkholderiaceae bacterium]|nr:phage holin family protein [Burkholderiaceae bacterium]
MDIARDAVKHGGAAPAAAPERVNSSRPDSGLRSETASRPSTSFEAQQPSRTTARPEPPPTRPSLSRFISELRAAFSARVHLFELEAKRAAWSAAYMLAFATAAALLGVTAWLILIGALIYGAVSAGVPWIVAAIAAIALHAVGAFLLVRAIRSMVENLTFAATRRTLEKADSAEASDGRRA